jgi:phosphatidylserine/phosphatidylglycerophosphate/cardiolipin synthase-like enzyme
MSPAAATTFITDAEIYRRVILELVPQAQRFVWLATADLKDLHVAGRGGRMIPFLEVLAGLAERGVALRLLHAKEPGPNFRRDFDRFPVLIDGLERILCPRVHLKAVIVDGSAAYSGSANLTGAGMGAKSAGRRNFEAGIVTTDPALVGPIMDQFDRIWMGAHCGTCGRREFCADFLETAGGKG